MSGQCKCGSRAINDDPYRLLCDTCWRDAEIARLRGELDECRRLLREAIAACEVYLPVVPDDQPLDLEEIVADLMEQQRDVERLRGELDECRRLLREAIAACEVYLPVVPDDQARVALLTLERYEAARAAGGEW